jgi:hypothetical protein
MEPDIWRYRDETLVGTDITGFHVEALDGSIGKVDKATVEATGNTIVVDTGPWIFGRKVMLPAGVVDRVDVQDGKVFVNRTKDEIKSSPEFDETKFGDDAYRGELAGHYGPGGPGYRDWAP